MQLTKLSIKNFRCFEAINCAIDNNITVIHGDNGVGKTSILEAIHYLCYLKSFRTHIPRELVRFDADNFFIRAELKEHGDLGPVAHDLYVGFQEKKRVVKFDQQQISSYKEIIDRFRVVTLTEDDLELIKGGPDIRRSFIDQYIFLHDPSFVVQLKEYRQILENRNALWQNRKVPSKENYALWTQQLWEKGSRISSKRTEHLEQLTALVNQLYKSHFDHDHEIELLYSSKKSYGQDFEEFKRINTGLSDSEFRFGRTLFGAHLDDISIRFKRVKSRSYASRGQQKLLVLLIKIAQVKLLTDLYGRSIFLLDDFMTDFDVVRLKTSLAILRTLDCQLIITCPIYKGPLKEVIGDSAEVVSV